MRARAQTLKGPAAGLGDSSHATMTEADKSPALISKYTSRSRIVAP